MHTNRKKVLLFYTSVFVLILLFTIGGGRLLLQEYSNARKRDARNILELYQKNILLTLQNELNYSQELGDMDPNLPEHIRWFERKSRKLLELDSIVCGVLFNGDTLQTAYPEELHRNKLGRDLSDLTYLYTMAKVVKMPVVEGPITLHDQEVFLFLHPLLKNDEYRGEIAIAVNKDQVIRQMNLEYLAELGYDYHLWKVNSQDGSKDVIAYSDGNLDFSYAAKTEFYLPTQWTLSLLPEGGWVPHRTKRLIIGASVAAGIVLWALILCVRLFITRTLYIKKLAAMDRQTGLLNRDGFCRELEGWRQKNGRPFTVFYFTIEDFGRTALMAGALKETEYLQSLPVMLKDYIKSSYIAGRIADGTFVIAIQEAMTEQDKLDIARDLSLKMMWKVRIHNQKLFLNENYCYAAWPDDGDSADALLTKLIDGYYSNHSNLLNQ